MVRRICDMEPSQRPRERLLEAGAAALSDAELIAVLLRTGRPGRGAVGEAHELLASSGGVTEVARMSVAELTARPGVGPAKAATLLAALELGNRLAGAEMRAAENLARPQLAGEFLVRRMQTERREICGFISLDQRNRFIALHELSRGTRNQAPVEPGELFRVAILDDAVAVILFHNHPSGSLEPSRDDLHLTERLVKAGHLLGVTVLDHLLVAGPRWISLRVTDQGRFRVDSKRATVQDTRDAYEVESLREE